MTVEIGLLDDATRPLAPKIDGVTPEQRARGNRLALIHAIHLSQLDETRRAMERVEAGKASVDARACCI